MLGIDPGLDGAMSLVTQDGGLLKTWDMPAMDRSGGKGRELNGYLLADLVREAKDMCRGHKLEAILELTGAMPTDSRPSAFKFGETNGVIRGVVCALYIPLHFVRPQVWKRYHGLLKRDKSSSRTLAMEKWPEQRDEFHRVKDADRAESALIAQFGLTVAGWEVK